MSEGHNWEIVGNLLQVDDVSISIDKIEEVRLGKPWWYYLMWVIMIFGLFVTFSSVGKDNSDPSNFQLIMFVAIITIPATLIIGQINESGAKKITIRTINRTYKFSTFGKEENKSFQKLYNDLLGKMIKKS